MLQWLVLWNKFIVTTRWWCFSTAVHRLILLPMHTLPQMSKIRAYLGQQLWNRPFCKKYFLLPFYNFIFHVIKQQTIPQWPCLNPETLSIFRVSGLYGTPEKTEHFSENTADWTNYITNLLFNWHDISIKTIYRTVIIATIHQEKLEVKCLAQGHNDNRSWITHSDYVYICIHEQPKIKSSSLVRQMWKLTNPSIWFYQLPLCCLCHKFLHLLIEKKMIKCQYVWVEWIYKIIKLTSVHTLWHSLS